MLGGGDCGIFAAVSVDQNDIVINSSRIAEAGGCAQTSRPSGDACCDARRG
jgi:hypothetical protein